MPLRSIEQLIFLSSAGPHIWVFHCRTPPPLLRVQSCYTLQPGPRWGINAQLWLHLVHKRQALGLPRFASVPPWTGSRLLLRLRTQSGLCSTFSFLWIFPLSSHSTALLDSIHYQDHPTGDLIVYLPSVCSLAPSFLINPYTSAHIPHTPPELSHHQ